MQKKIRLLYRKIIDANSTQIREKYIFDATYSEFLMQAQFYNQNKKYKTYAKLKNNVSGAEKLNFLTSAAAVGYVKQLNGTIPDILNNVGKHFLRFENYKFEIINSELSDKNKHRIAIEFISDPIIWLDTIGSQLLVAADQKRDPADDAVFTHVFSLQPYLQIYPIKEVSV